MLLQSILLLVLCASQSFAATPPQEIVVGTTLPLRAEGKQIEMGLQAAFGQLNQAEKGAKQFKLLLLDDGKKLDKAVRNTTELQEKTPFILGTFTPGIASALKPKLESGEIMLFGPEENNTHLYANTPKNLILTRPSLRAELDALVDYAINTLKRRKIAVFYVDSPYGRHAIDDANASLKQHDLTPVAVASYPSGTVEIGRAVAAIVDAQPDAIICLGRRHATYNFLLGVVNKGLISTDFLGTSYLLPIQQYLQNPREIDLIATSVVPSPWRSMQVEVKNYRTAMDEYYPYEPYSPISLSSYLTARSFVTIARTIQGPLTPAAVALAASTRTLAQPIWLSPSFGKPWQQVRK